MCAEAEVRTKLLGQSLHPFSFLFDQIEKLLLRDGDRSPLIFVMKVIL